MKKLKKRIRAAEENIMDVAQYGLARDKLLRTDVAALHAAMEHNVEQCNIMNETINDLLDAVADLQDAHDHNARESTSLAEQVGDAVHMLAAELGKKFQRDPDTGELALVDE